jgi:hypothetical protein
LLKEGLEAGRKLQKHSETKRERLYGLLQLRTSRRVLDCSPFDMHGLQNVKYTVEGVH